MKKQNLILAALVLILLTSCYSVRVKVTNGPGPEPADTESEVVTAGELVRILDTVAKVGIETNEYPINIPDCKSGALHSVEYRTTFGGLLKYILTLGKRRTVKVKYVCVKKVNTGEIDIE
ncbi:MAG: hypothetical protein HKN48_10865 [Flavobacteriaceae bacterium]|nr:hypothetical protein [Flavobacteriaceae bacterium]